MTSRRVGLVSFVFILLAVLAGPARAERLTFAWPVPGTVTVEERVAKQGMAAVMRYDVTLTKAPDGKRLAVQLKRFDFLEVNGQDARQPALRKQLGEALRMASATPTLLVSPQGTFEDITGLERVVNQLTASLPAAQRAAMRKAVNDPQFSGMLKESSAGFWNVWVGLWAGADLPPGGTREVEQPLVLADGSSIDRPLKVTHHGPAGPPGHVRLSFSSSLEGGPGNEALKTFIASMLVQLAQSTGRQIPPDQVQGGEVATGGEVVTDPSTLRPVSARSHKRITIQIKGQPPQTREERHDYTFTWGEAAGRKR